MNLRPRRRFGWVALLALLFATAGVPIADAAAPAAVVEGNTYTSEQFGYTLTWDDSWFVVSETSDPVEGDDINLTNGLTFAAVTAANDIGGDAALVLAIFYGGLARDPSVESVTRVEGTQVITDERASEVFVITFVPDEEAETQAPAEITIYVDIRTLETEGAAAIFQAFTTSELFASEWPAIEKLLNGWSVVSGSGTTQGGDDDDDNTPVVPVETPTEEAAGTPGEPAPVFVAGQWRAAVRSAALAERFPDLGLRVREGKEWLVVIADVTNWSANEGEFNARAFTVAIDGAEDPVRTARGSTGSVNNQLGLGLDSETLRQMIPAEETARVAFVFLVPAGSSGFVLQSEGQGVALGETVGSELAVDALPELVSAASVVPGEIVSSSDGRSLRIELEGSSTSARVRLLGVTPPGEGACFENAAEGRLDDLSGAAVLVEEDEAGASSSSERYVWLVNDDGTRTLLNAQVVREGLASANEESPAGARFIAWMLESQNRAEAEPVGLWAECDGAGGDDDDVTPTVEVTEEATSESGDATAEATATATATGDDDDDEGAPPPGTSRSTATPTPES